MSASVAQLSELAGRAIELEKWPLAQLVRFFEDTRAEGLATKLAIVRELDGRGVRAKALVLGFTGTPGTGKSTLVGELARKLTATDERASVAVLAVDPSSYRSGGSILGDRTRVQFPAGERRLYFRSQASDQELGGIGRATYPVIRLLERFFDYVLVETVGIGQSEVEIERVADRVYLVLQPFAGDQVQFMKAGIMEVPHVFIMNKSDVGEPARRSLHALRASIDFVRPGEANPPPILRTSALTGEGLDELVADIAAHRVPRSALVARDRESYFFEKWVRDEYGRFGIGLLDAQGGAANLLAAEHVFEAAQAKYEPPVAPSHQG